jgi:hypothetical protein
MATWNFQISSKFQLWAWLLHFLIYVNWIQTNLSSYYSLHAVCFHAKYVLLDQVTLGKNLQLWLPLKCLNVFRLGNSVFVDIRNGKIHDGWVSGVVNSCLVNLWYMFPDCVCVGHAKSAPGSWRLPSSRSMDSGPTFVAVSQKLILSQFWFFQQGLR